MFYNKFSRLKIRPSAIIALNGDHLIDINKKIIQSREHEQKEVYEKVRDLYDQRDEARDKFLDMDKYLIFRTSF